MLINGKLFADPAHSTLVAMVCLSAAGYLLSAIGAASDGFELESRMQLERLATGFLGALCGLVPWSTQRAYWLPFKGLPAVIVSTAGILVLASYLTKLPMFSPPWSFGLLGLILANLAFFAHLSYRLAKRGRQRGAVLVAIPSLIFTGAFAAGFALQAWPRAGWLGVAAIATVPILNRVRPLEPIGNAPCTPEPADEKLDELPNWLGQAARKPPKFERRSAGTRQKALLLWFEKQEAAILAKLLSSKGYLSLSQTDAKTGIPKLLSQEPEFRVLIFNLDKTDLPRDELAILRFSPSPRPHLIGVGSKVKDSGPGKGSGVRIFDISLGKPVKASELFKALDVLKLTRNDQVQEERSKLTS